MRRRAHPWLDSRGSAGAEMAMVLPLLLLILFGSIELGRFFYNQHILVKAVRDGAVFAARQPIDKFNCGASTIDASVVTATQTLVKTGGLSGNGDLLPQWTGATAPFTMTLACVTAAGGTTLTGIYTVNNGQVPVITVTASLPYRPITGFLGTSFANAKITASEQASVVGI